MTLTFADPMEWWLEISPAAFSPTRDSPTRADWQRDRAGLTPGDRHTAYINQLCLTAFLPWFQAEYAPEAAVWPSRTGLEEIWQLVSGIAIALPQMALPQTNRDSTPTRLVLIPSETVDQSQLEVPQEWVDIPSWAADYYLAVQIQLDAEAATGSGSELGSESGSGWLRVWGYATHQQLKEQGNYDHDDRTYGLAAHQLTQDMTVFWLTYQLCLEVQTQVAIAPLPTLSLTQAENLIQYLSHPIVTFPRLAAPFSHWGVLLEQPDWRHRLCQQRQETAPERPTRLSEWFKQIVNGGWRSLASLTDSGIVNLTPSFRSGLDLNPDETQQTKLIHLTDQTVVLLVKLHPDSEQRVGIWIQLHPTGDNTFVPEDLTLTLLSESGEVIQSVQSQQEDYYIQLNRFKCPLGTAFSIQLRLNETQLIEDFIV